MKITTTRIFATLGGDPLFELHSTASGSHHMPNGPKGADIECGDCKRPLCIRTGAICGTYQAGEKTGKRYAAHCMLCDAEIGQIFEVTTVEE
jgi:hypothetical protein